jgi:RNA polymerase-binding transcription factor DksA
MAPAKKTASTTTSTGKGSAPARKKAPAKKKAPAGKAPAKKAPAKKAPAKKAPAKKAPAKKAPAKKAPAKKAPAKKAPAGKAPAKKAPAKKAPAKKKAPAFDKKFLDAQKVALEQERVTLAEQAESLKAEAESLAMDREPGDVQFDEESGEGDSIAVERDFDLARAAKNQQVIEEIDAALRRIVQGTYGICEYSGEPIPKERLRAIPWARERVEYKTSRFR